MGFLSVLHHVGGFMAAGLTAAQPFEPIIEAAFPPAAAILKAIAIAEQTITAPKSGPQKKILAVAVAKALQPAMDSEVLSSAMDELVDLLNKLDTVLGKIQAPAAGTLPAGLV